VSKWIAQNLWDENYFSAALFPRSVRLYRTPLDSPMLVRIIDGTTVGAKWSKFRLGKFTLLVNTIKELTRREAAFWFYITDPDNALSIIEWVGRIRGAA